MTEVHPETISTHSINLSTGSSMAAAVEQTLPIHTLLKPLEDMSRQELLIICRNLERSLQLKDTEVDRINRHCDFLLKLYYDNEEQLAHKNRELIVCRELLLETQQNLSEWKEDLLARRHSPQEASSEDMGSPAPILAHSRLTERIKEGLKYIEKEHSAQANETEKRDDFVTSKSSIISDDFTYSDEQISMSSMGNERSEFQEDVRHVHMNVEESADLEPRERYVRTPYRAERSKYDAQSEESSRSTALSAGSPKREKKVKSDKNKVPRFAPRLPRRANSRAQTAVNQSTPFASASETQSHSSLNSVSASLNIRANEHVDQENDDAEAVDNSYYVQQTTAPIDMGSDWSAIWQPKDDGRPVTMSDGEQKADILRVDTDRAITPDEELEIVDDRGESGNTESREGEYQYNNYAYNNSGAVRVSADAKTEHSSPPDDTTTTDPPHNRLLREKTVMHPSPPLLNREKHYPTPNITENVPKNSVTTVPLENGVQNSTTFPTVSQIITDGDSTTNSARPSSRRSARPLTGQSIRNRTSVSELSRSVVEPSQMITTSDNSGVLGVQGKSSPKIKSVNNNNKDRPRTSTLNRDAKTSDPKLTRRSVGSALILKGNQKS